MQQPLSAYFKEFQFRRSQNHQYRKVIQNQQIDRKSEQWKQNLREKFVNQAKKYIGIPYHSRYHNEDSQYYNAPLYLDCSGLVRQIIFDLREDFGFTLGKWNQAYQYDLLDKEIEFDQLQYGDLVFYEGTYYNNERAFQHNIVHVEIYLGGERTIAARLQKGVIQEFESYKFESKNYFDIKFHYKSINPWLEGEYKSFCEEHPWRDDRDIWISEKYSIFAKDVNIPQQLDHNQQRIYVGQGNNGELIKSFFRQKGFIIMETVNDAFKNDYFFKWVQCPQSIDYFSFQPQKQIINHIPKAAHYLGHKIPMLELLRENKLTAYQPQTYRLDKMDDVVQFFNDQEQGVWIMKPYNLNCGRGIVLIDNINKFKEDLKKGKQFQVADYHQFYIQAQRDKAKAEIQDHLGIQKQKQEEQDQNIIYKDINPQSIVQKYIEHPLLLNNRKFDIRCYALVANLHPYTVLYHKGYARLSLFEYTIENLDEKVVHLTNNSIQKQHPDYKAKRESTIWSMEQLISYLQEYYSQDRIDLMFTNIREQIQNIFKAASNKFISQGQKGEFELFGLDFIIDQDLNPYFLEANVNPALFTENQVQKDIIPKVVHQTLQIVLDIFFGRQYEIGTFEQLI